MDREDGNDRPVLRANQDAKELVGVGEPRIEYLHGLTKRTRRSWPDRITTNFVLNSLAQL